MKKYTYSEWMEEGKKRFGKNFENWKFICPACGHIQSVKDFLDLELDPNDAFRDCIGRHNGNMKPAGENNQFGCNWCAYGLFGTLCKGVTVITENNDEIEIFDFAPTEKGGV